MPHSADERFDAVIIGSGQAGNPLAVAFANAGRRTVLIEREHVGGTCINEGCTPTKTMIASARTAYVVARAADYGVDGGRAVVDLAAVRDRKREIVESFRSGSERRLNETEGLTLVIGEAHFAGAHRIEVDLRGGGRRAITAPLIFLNTGTRPARPELPGLGGIEALDSTSIMELDAVPEHLVILGGGYVGVEFGQMFRRFGSRVTVVQRRDRLLPREDPDIASAVEGILRDEGIAIELGAEAREIIARGDGAFSLVVRRGDGERRIDGTRLLFAAGRRPNTDRLRPAAAGVEIDERGYVRVNGRLETNVPGIYALGDVNGGPAFTHVSYDDHRIVRANLLEGGAATTEGRLIPYTVFLDPQLGRVGWTETEARAAGRAVRVARMPMRHVARALEVGEPRGAIKAIVDPASERILGAAVLGIEGGELMAVLQTAMIASLPYTALRDGIFAHPTLAESLNNLFTSFDE